MGILSRIGSAVVGVIGAVLDGIDYIVDSVRSIFGIEKVKRKLTEADKLFIRHELRQQWLALPEGARQEIPGVEYEGEMYYETPQ